MSEPELELKTEKTWENLEPKWKNRNLNLNGTINLKTGIKNRNQNLKTKNQFKKLELKQKNWKPESIAGTGMGFISVLPFLTTWLKSTPEFNSVKYNSDGFQFLKTGSKN